MPRSRWGQAQRRDTRPGTLDETALRSPPPSPRDPTAADQRFANAIADFAHAEGWALREPLVSQRQKRDLCPRRPSVLTRSACSAWLPDGASKLDPLHTQELELFEDDLHARACDPRGICGDSAYEVSFRGEAGGSLPEQRCRRHRAPDALVGELCDRRA